MAITVTNTTRLIKISTGEYPRYFSQVRQDNPNTMFGYPTTDITLKGFDHAPVLESEIPQGDVVTEIAPLLKEDGYYYTQYEVRPFTSEEYQEKLNTMKSSVREDIKYTLEQDLMQGIDYTFNGVKYNLKLRPFDISGYLATREIAKINTNDTYSINIGDVVIESLTSQQIEELTLNILQTYKEFMSDYWDFVKRLNSASAFEDIPERPETFIKE